MIQDTKYKILSIDTSCDETSASVTSGISILSNIIWSQASLHAKWGGVVPSLAKREHEERIVWVIQKALKTAGVKIQDLNAVAVTVGPGLAIALEVGIKKAKGLSKKYNLPFIPVNHIEGHLLSPLARSKNSKLKTQNSKTEFPALGIVASGGHTEIIHIKNIGKYKIIAETIDDALGESLDKATRFLGFGYPGGKILEKIAKEGDPHAYNLPIPMIGREKEMSFSYSGLKTALVRQINNIKVNKNNLSKKTVADLAAAYQQTSFNHFIRILNYIIKSTNYPVKNILAGGGVMANTTLRKMIRKTASFYGIKMLFPYSKKLYGDNAAMIGIAANFKFEKGEIIKPKDLDKIDRIPGAKIDKPFL